MAQGCRDLELLAWILLQVRTGDGTGLAWGQQRVKGNGGPASLVGQTQEALGAGPLRNWASHLVRKVPTLLTKGNLFPPVQFTPLRPHTIKVTSRS